jgi:hypothetical protein
VQQRDIDSLIAKGVEDIPDVRLRSSSQAIGPVEYS